MPIGQSVMSCSILILGVVLFRPLFSNFIQPLWMIRDIHEKNVLKRSEENWYRNLNTLEVFAIKVEIMILLVNMKGRYSMHGDISSKEDY